MGCLSSLAADLRTKRRALGRRGPGSDAPRDANAWVVVEDMDPGPLHEVIEYEGEIDGRPYHVYGGLMERRNVVYNRAFLGYAYRFVEETTELVKGLSTAHLQIFLGESWKECLGTHKNRLEHGREELFEDIRARAKEWLDAAARQGRGAPAHEPRARAGGLPEAHGAGARGRLGGRRAPGRPVQGAGVECTPS